MSEEANPTEANYWCPRCHQKVVLQSTDWHLENIFDELGWAQCPLCKGESNGPDWDYETEKNEEGPQY